MEDDLHQLANFPVKRRQVFELAQILEYLLQNFDLALFYHLEE